MATNNYSAGVKAYRETYWDESFTPRDSDILACFKITPQEGIDREEITAAVAAESSTGTWTTVWTDHLTDVDYYKACAYRIENVPGDPSCFYVFVAYPIDLFEEGSVVNVLTSLVGNVFGFKALRAIRLEDVRFPMHYVMTCGGPQHGIQVERDILNKYGRPLLGGTIKPKLGLSAKNYGRAVYECLRGGLDFTKDDENVNSQPFMRWRHRYDFVAEAVKLAQRETGERKGHYLNVTAPNVEARNQGRNLENEGRNILEAAAKSSPELAMAMEAWKEIRFEFDTVDKLDVAQGDLAVGGRGGRAGCAQ